MLLCIRERALAAGILAVVVCALLGGWLLSRPKVYQAEARLLLDRNERVLDMKQVVDQTIGGGQNDAMFATYLEQITTPAVVAKVVSSLTPEERERVWHPYARKDEPVSRHLDNEVKQIVAQGISAARQGNTFFITVRMRHRDPSMAALIATRMATEFIDFQLDRNASVNNSAIAFLRKETERLRVKAEEAEQALQQYRESTGMVSLDETRNIVVDRMKSFSTSVTNARIARLGVEARLRQAEAILSGSGDPIELATTAEFSGLANIQTQIDALRTQRAIMGERYGARHPSMIENQRSREALEKLRGELIVIAMANLRNQREKAVSEEQQLQAQLEATEKESLRLDSFAIRFDVLRREAEANRATYARVLNQLSETTVTARLENSNLRLSEEAFTPGVPLEPNAKKIQLLLAILGLGIFICYPISLELLFDRIRGWEDVESYLNLPLLGELSLFKKMPVADRPLVIARSKDEDAVEAVRSLYAQLKITSHVEVPKTVLVTSTLPGEGKSFVASNLAGAFAEHGIKTLLVDTDLRRPTQHRAFGVSNETGILPWLEKKRPVAENPMEDSALGIKNCSPNMFLLTTGGTTRRSTEALDATTIRSLLDSLRKHFDVIVIDTPPAGIFPDAITLAEHASEMVFVVRHNFVSRPAVRRVIERIAATGIEQAGIVLNMMPTGRGSAAYYSGYAHYGSKYYSDYNKPQKS